MKDLVRSFAAIVVAALLFAGCEGNITEPLSPEAEISESVAVSQQNCTTTVTSNDHSTIQSAVDAADPGDNVCVDGGTYTEQVVINKDLTLTGINDPTIEYPDDADQYGIVESQTNGQYNTWEPIIFAYGGTADGSNEVSGEETIDVSVTGFTIDGLDMQPDAQRKVGIFFRNVQSTGTIADNTVKDIGIGDKETFGILAYGNTKVTIADNTVKDFQRGGIGANGDGGAHPSPVVTITGNTVTGTQASEGNWAPNGIQVGYGATGAIVDNTVNFNWFEGEDWKSSGILIFESEGVTVRNNTLSENEVAIAVGTWGSFLSSASNNKIIGNTVNGADYGVRLRVITFPGLTTVDPVLNNNKVANNELSGEGGIAGISISTIDAWEEYSLTDLNNKLINNQISGFGEDVVEDGSDTKVQANDQPATP